MPKIRINEYDMTGVIQKSPISNIIYIPIPTDKAVPLVTESGKVVSICYCNGDIDGLDPSFLVDIFDGYRLVTIHIPKIKRR